MEYNKEWEYGTPVDCDCENNFIHVDCGCKSKEVCECENILLEISKLKSEDIVLQREIDAISGASISGVTEEQLNEAIASAKTEIEAEIPSLSGYATEQWVEDKHYITGVDLSDYALKYEIPVVPTSNTAFTNDAGYITGVDLSNYATLEDIPTVPTNVSAFINDVSYATTSELLQHISNLQQQINSLVASISGCCGSSGETQYRWITMTGENDYWCSGTTKMSEEKEQSSTDGLTWTDTGNIRSGNTVLQTDCEDCGYIPTATTKARLYFSYEAGKTNTSVVNNCPSNVTKITYYKNGQWNHITGCSTIVEPSIDGRENYNVIIHTNTTYINNNQFKETDLSGVCSANFITNIGSGAFENCSGITRMYLDGNALGRIDLEAIGNNAFKNCSSLRTVDLTENTIVPTLGTGVFDGCSSLVAIYVNSSLVNDFKTAPGWSTYANLIQGLV